MSNYATMSDEWKKACYSLNFTHYFRCMKHMIQASRMNPTTSGSAATSKIALQAGLHQLSKSYSRRQFTSYPKPRSTAHSVPFHVLMIPMAFLFMSVGISNRKDEPRFSSYAFYLTYAVAICELFFPACLKDGWMVCTFGRDWRNQPICFSCLFRYADESL